MKENTEIFSRNFALMIAEMGLKAKDIAQTLGVSPQFVTNMKKGRNAPTYGALIKLSEVYNVNLNWLCRNVGEMKIGEANPQIVEIAREQRKNADKTKNAVMLLERYAASFEQRQKEADEALESMTSKVERILDYLKQQGFDTDSLPS